MAYAAINLSELWIISPGFDDLLVNGDTTDSDGNSFTIDAIDDGASWDSPVPVDVAVQRWMTDGAVAATQGHENRTPTFQVRISAATSRDLAAAEASLVKRSAKACLLKWVPPEGDPDAPATIFEVWTWHLSHTFSGTDERHLQRYYTLTFTAKPWARSENLTTAIAPTPPATTTTISIDACTATTNWAATGGTLSTSGGAVHCTVTGVPAHTVGTLSLTRTASVTGLSALPYLMIDTASSGALLNSITVLVDSVALTKVAAIGSVGYYALVTGTASFTTLRVTANLYTGGTPSTIDFSVADVSATDTIGGVGSRKQLTRHLDVGGSVKTSGSIQLASTTAPLGTCLVYTVPDAGLGFSAAMRPYRTTGNSVTPDSTCVSGNREAFVTSGASVGPITFGLPPGMPESSYVVVGRFIFSAAATMSVTISSAFGLLAGSFSGTVSASAAGAAWGIITAVPVPWVGLPSSRGITGATIQATATATASATVTLDELYLFDFINGGLTLVVNNTGLRLWIDAPDADPLRNRPAVYIGSQVNRSDAFTPPQGLIVSRGDHDLDPDGTTLFTVTDGVDNAAATASFYRRWHTHAGD